MSIIPTVNPSPDNFVDNRKNLLGFSTPEMVKFFESINEKKFRAIQVIKWIHHFGVTDFEQMTNLSKDLRIKLAKVAHVTPPEVEYKHYSNDGTRKWVFKVRGSLVETVLIPADDNKVNGRKTLCISSQVGCALECTFCSTGKQGFERNLTTDEIIGQLWVANQSYMEDVPYSDRIRTVTNVVMMGMGEPLLNFNPVISSMLLMLDDNAYGMSKRRVTLSTSGVVPMMDKMNELIDVSLAISLHAPNDELRNELVPVNKKYPLEKLMAAAHRYLKVNERQKKHVTIEYVLLADVNDTSQHAYELIELLKDLPCKINLIPFNPFPHAPYKKPSNNRVFNFQKKLSDAGFVCTVRQTRGDDIDAACGQLVGQVKDKTKRAKKWQESIETQSTQVT